MVAEIASGRATAAVAPRPTGHAGVHELRSAVHRRITDAVARIGELGERTIDSLLVIVLVELIAHLLVTDLLLDHLVGHMAEVAGHFACVAEPGSQRCTVVIRHLLL